MFGRASGSGTADAADDVVEADAVVAGWAVAAVALFAASVAPGAFLASTCGNSLAIFSDGRGSGNGMLRPRATGSRLFGTKMMKRALFRNRPDTRPASAPAPDR